MSSKDNAPGSDASNRVTQPIYDFPDIAALLVLMLRNLDAAGDAYCSFADQLGKSSDVLDNVKFKDSMRVVSFLHGNRSDLFDNVHNALRLLLEELEVTKLQDGTRWSICAFISRNQIARIGRL
jgi:hypothetical protein